MDATDAAAPRLSVLVPAYNAAAHIEACLRSVLRQLGDGDRGFEVLVLDDASTDDTRERVATVASSHPGQVRLIPQTTNAGISAARNRLLAEARGHYLWFLDADDLVLPGAVADLCQLLERDAPDLVLCDFRYLRGERMSRPRCTCHAPADVVSHDRARLVAATLAAGELHVWSKIAKRELWQQVVFPVGRHFEDIAGTCQLLLRTRQWVHAHRPWVAYRQHPGSIMATLTHARLDEWMSALEGMQPLLDDPGVGAAPAALRAIADFRLRNLASALRRAGRLVEAERAPARDTLAGARGRLFPQGTRTVLRGWARRGWWLRALRTARALRAIDEPGGAR